MIPQWRYIHYTDDGCALYECLQCKHKWEARSSPGYRMFDTHEYVATWQFCPACGVKWTGSPRTDDNEIGPRRRRIRDAEDSRRFEDKPEPPFWWLIECRDITTYVKTDEVKVGGWYPSVFLPWWAGAAKVYKALGIERRGRVGDTDWITCDAPPYVKTYEYRARIFRDRLPWNANICYWMHRL
jgi:hypothetical protein